MLYEMLKYILLLVVLYISKLQQTVAYVLLMYNYYQNY